MSSFNVVKEIVDMAGNIAALKNELAGFNKSFQIKPSDSSPYYVDIKDGRMNLKEGELPGAGATVSATDQVLSDVFSGKTDAIKAFMQGQLKVSGDVFSAQKLTSIISKIRK